MRFIRPFSKLSPFGLWRRQKFSCNPHVLLCTLGFFKNFFLSKNQNFRFQKRSIVFLFALLSFLFPLCAEETLNLVQNQSKSLKLSSNIVEVGVANPNIANAKFSKPDILHVFGLAPGRTSIFVVNDDGRVSNTFAVNVDRDVGPLQSDIKRLFPQEKIVVRPLNSAVVITGDVTSARTANLVESLAKAYAAGSPTLNQLNVTSPNQVQIQVKVAEVSRQAQSQYGINWTDLLKSGRSGFGMNSNFSGSLTDTAQLTYSFIDPLVNINAVVNALSTRGLATVLAEPDLTTVSGKTATILAGGEFPIPISNGVNGIQVQFREFGVRLSFTPVVLDSGRVQLHVNQEVSEISQASSITLSGIVIPGLKTRRAETTVDLANGQGIAFAGLLQNDTLTGLSGLTGLEKIPILGALFRSNNFQRNQTELVFLLSVKLVGPTSTPERLALPTDGFIPASTYDRIVNGTAAKKLIKQPIQWGTYGFQID
jgi:pilus assembly protein CpaC